MVEDDENGEYYDYSISDFIKDMPPPKLSCCWRNYPIGSRHLWIFSTDDHHSPPTQSTISAPPPHLDKKTTHLLLVQRARRYLEETKTTDISFNYEVVQQQDGKELLSDDDNSTKEAVRKNQLNVVIAEQNDMAAVTSLGRICREGTSEREHRRTITMSGSLSHEDLKQHLGKKLDDAAEILGVSRSTMKRACRVNGIKKWPFPKRKKLKPSPSNLNHVNGQVPMHTMGDVSHTIPNVTPKEDVRTVTVKATSGVEIIRFQLCFSSRKVDLVEKATWRSPLKDGTFNIKYDEGDDWILIACHEDLEECIGISKGKNIIKMSVEPITNHAS